MASTFAGSSAGGREAKMAVINGENSSEDDTQISVLTGMAPQTPDGVRSALYQLPIPTDTPLRKRDGPAIHTSKSQTCYAKFPGVDAELVGVVDESFSALMGQTAMLEVIMAFSVPDRFYERGAGHTRANCYLADITRQISHRYPRTNTLEIGDGTEGTTKGTLEVSGDALPPYTFTGISSAFGNARETFRRHANKMIYNVFDIENGLLPQGFPERPYDIAIATRK
ncbi:MAG: polyketide synthase [Geoglossum simile]|nr:MAG: polyketide synthase [Geoglossum simile]